MKKYRVAPQEKKNITVSLFEMQLKTLITTNKSEALKYAKDLKKEYNSVSFSVDTYEKGICVKNEFGHFIDKVVFYSTVDYKQKKTKSTFKFSDYLCQEDIIKYNIV